MTFSSSHILCPYHDSHCFPGRPPGVPRARGHREVPRDTEQEASRVSPSFSHSLTHTFTVSNNYHVFKSPPPAPQKCLCLKKKFCRTENQSWCFKPQWSYSLITACCVAQLNTISQKALKIQYPFSQTVCLSIPSHPPALNQPTTELLWTAADFPCSAAKQNHTVSYF